MLKHINYKKLVEDAAWLQDELELLKGMISIVPCLDKPLEQESICDMIRKIGVACESFYKPVIKSALEHKGDLHLSITRNFELQNQDKNPEDVIDLLDMIKNARKELLEMMMALQPDDLKRKVYMEEGITTIEEILTDMVLFDRKQLKLIAERTLALDSDHSAYNK